MSRVKNLTPIVLTQIVPSISSPAKDFDEIRSSENLPRVDFCSACTDLQKSENAKTPFIIAKESEKSFQAVASGEIVQGSTNYAQNTATSAIITVNTATFVIRLGF